MSSNEIWVPNLFPKQQEVFNLGTWQDAGTQHPESATAAMISGPRYTGKTIAIGHRVARHLWETPGARCGLLHKTTRNITDGGVLNDLTDVVFPEWIESGIGFDYTTFDGNGVPGPKADGRTRSIFLRVRNAFGGESELRIIAVEHDCEIEQKLKSSRWSMLWLNELANFKDPRIFTCSYEQLRMVHLPPWQHLWIADTNPAPEGTEAWQYKFFYQRDWSVLQFVHDEKKKEEHQGHVDRLKKALVLVEIMLHDNLALSPEEVSVRHALHSGDPGEYDRDVLGKWTKGSGGRNRHFADVFCHDVHVVQESPNDSDYIALSPSTSEILVGWDLGSSVNHGVVFMEKRIVKIADIEWPVWMALREIESVGEKMKMSDIGERALDILEELKKLYRRPLGFRHWADDTALNTFRPTGEGYDYLEIQAATQGKIVMQGVYKPKGSVELRIRLLKRLLREKRFYVSSQCPGVMSMLENAARGTKSDDKVTGMHKHIFDALTYPIFMESAYELEEIAFKPSKSNRNMDLISVRL